MKDYQTFCDEVAKKHDYQNWNDLTDWGDNTVENMQTYIEEAAQLYASECVKEAVKLARYQMGDISGSLEPNPYTEQEILSKLNL